MKNEYIISVENLKGRGKLAVLCADAEITLKWIVKKTVMKV
jgi:hypothetical protein